MEPEFQPGDRLLLDPAAYRAADPSYGDVVVMIDPADEERLLLKRVAGLPGDVVQLGETIVRAGEAPGTSPGPPGVGEVQIPGNHYFLLSDRSVRTRDSRQFGPVRRGRLIGRVWKRTFPPDRVGEV